MNSANDLLDGPFEAMDLGGDEDGSSADSIGSPAYDHPGPVHRLENSDGSVLDYLLVISELELVTEPVDVDRWIGDLDNLLWTKDDQSELLDMLIDSEDVPLGGIREVD